MRHLRLNMQDIARSGHITRWHSVRCARNQTLAEHHYLVAMIARELMERIFGDRLSPDTRLQVLEYALTHDTPELLTGDLPAPLKRRIAEIAGEDNPLAQIESEIAPEISKRKQALAGTAFADLVKLADLMDGCLFIREEGIGRHAALVAELTERSLCERLEEARTRFPELDWDQVWVLYREMRGELGTDNRFLLEQR
ncbi:HD domain-containing protein [Caldichromatium japonicum]|uniref:HD domain-containing protein n=2 Tax=Caldichromatium japonicum TaxID=2699430 RepID=A0A6G7VG61_9GAMM|nr:HD domain-containing protein [Caldichromatium japonicum]